MSNLWKRLKRLLTVLTSFPLLAKELTEAANRRRTYTLRIVYALLLYGVFALSFPNVSQFDSGYGPYSFAGLGIRLFRILFALQCAGVVLFLPALMSGRITQEKERDSLVLLLLTELSPWRIALEKYFSGLILMLSFFFLGLPLVGVAYAYGGLALKDIGWLSFSLVILCFQIGAFSLFCSAWCRTTVGSFLCSYLLGALLYGGPWALAALATLFSDQEYLSRDYAPYITALCPPLAVFANDSSSGLAMPLALAPSIGSVFVFLGLTRFFLVRRALLPAANFGLRLFERMDRLMKHLNRVTGGSFSGTEKEPSRATNRSSGGKRSAGFWAGLII